jgi:hypothetical protein
MKVRNALAGAVLIAVATMALAPTAGAETTNTTFQVTAGGLGVTVPASALVDTAAPGDTTASGSLGDVTVTDDRGAMAASWITTVTSTTFTTGTQSADETVTVANISYASGAASAKTGVGNFIALVNTPLSVAAAGRTVAFTGGTGNNSATWNPTLSFALQGSQVSGTYSGTITHSVA